MVKYDQCQLRIPRAASGTGTRLQASGLRSQFSPSGVCTHPPLLQPPKGPFTKCRHGMWCFQSQTTPHSSGASAIACLRSCAFTQSPRLTERTTHSCRCHSPPWREDLCPPPGPRIYGLRHLAMQSPKGLGPSSCPISHAPTPGRVNHISAPGRVAKTDAASATLGGLRCISSACNTSTLFSL